MRKNLSKEKEKIIFFTSAHQGSCLFMFIYLFICLSIYLFIYLFIYLSFFTSPLPTNKYFEEFSEANESVDQP